MGQLTRFDQSSGFSYPALLAALLVLGLAAQAAVTSSAIRAKRTLNTQVAATGQHFLYAVESYYISGGDRPALPATLDDLLEDRRNGLERHLRSAPASPFGGIEWEVLRINGQGISGLKLTPPTAAHILPATFGANDSDWSFVFDIETYERSQTNAN